MTGIRLPGRSIRRWWRWQASGQWRSAPGRSLVSVLAVAIGVALALAIHLVNASALAEFRQAIATVNGDAHAQVRARAGSIDEGLYESLARAASGDTDAAPMGVAALSPVVEVEVAVVGLGPGAPRTLRVLGIDPFAAATVTPALLASPEGDSGGSASALFDPDAIFLSAAARRALGVAPGEPLHVRVGLATVRLRVAGGVPGAAEGQRIAVMDIGSAQWHLGLVGRLTRIDLRFDDGADRTTVERALAPLLGTQAFLAAPDDDEQRMSNVSRAYRVNLDVLALVALFTGAFLVFSAMALSTARQQGELALAGVLGATRREILAAVLAQGAIVGGLGAMLGLLGGVALAATLLQVVGGDLGGGYFSGSQPRLVLAPGALAAFGLLGLVVGLAGAAAPAWAAARQPPAQALRSGAGEYTLAAGGGWRGPLALALLGALLLLPGPIAGLPVAAYLAIAAWLLAGIACVPLLTRLAGTVGGPLVERALWPRPPAWLALARLSRSPGTVAAGLAGVVAAFALSSAMAILVTSFRASVSDWLDAVLPAELYGRAAPAQRAALGPAEQAAIATAPGVARAEFLRSIELALDPGRPPVTLLVRTVDPRRPQAHLPLTGGSLAAPAGTVPIWVSEAMVDLYGLRPGNEATLPLGGEAAAQRVFVAGVWRDFARQHGTVVMHVDDHRRITGESIVSDVALWLVPGVDDRELVAAIGQRAPALQALEWRSASEIRTLSLRIFDRSFAVTYALEAIAIVVGLFGVAAATAGDALGRAREFGMLRHVGARARDIAAQLATEATLGVSVAVVWGGLVGAAIGLVLIERVNPQSFHWTMSVHWPLALLAGSGAALIAASVAAALLAVRGALGDGPVRAVRQDW